MAFDLFFCIVFNKKRALEFKINLCFNKKPVGSLRRDDVHLPANLMNY